MFWLIHLLAYLLLSCLLAFYTAFKIFCGLYFGKDCSNHISHYLLVTLMLCLNLRWFPQKCQALIMHFSLGNSKDISQWNEQDKFHNSLILEPVLNSPLRQCSRLRQLMEHRKHMQVRLRIVKQEDRQCLSLQDNSLHLSSWRRIYTDLTRRFPCPLASNSFPQ